MREEQLIRTFVDLTDVLTDDYDVVDLLTQLASRCVEVLDVTTAGLMLANPLGELQVVASSSETMRMLELFELQASEGPCFQCFSAGEPIENVLLAGDDHSWSLFAPRAIDAGFRSVTALPMRLRGTTIGALNLFRSDDADLQPRDIAAAQAFADVATISILQHRAAVEAHTINTQLTAALDSRVVIEQAKGMIVVRAGVDMEQAFERLRGHARRNNLQLSQLAREVVDGTVDPSSLGAVDSAPSSRRRRS